MRGFCVFLIQILLKTQNFVDVVALISKYAVLSCNAITQDRKTNQRKVFWKYVT